MSRKRNALPPVPVFETLMPMPLPSVDLRDKELQVSTMAFTSALDRIIALGKADISRHRQEHSKKLAREKEKGRIIEDEIEACGIMETAIGAAMKKESEEKKESEADIANADRKWKSMKEKCSTIDAELEQIKAKMAGIKKEHRKEKGILSQQAATLAPELHQLEQRMGWNVQGVGKDMLLLKFTHLDERDWTKEFTIQVDLSERTYRVPRSSPLLPTLPILVDQLNETREFYKFVRDVREAFKGLVSSQRWSVTE